MKKLIAMLALVASFNTIAATQTTVDLSKLTPEQRAQITQQVKELSSEPTNVSATIRQEAEAWGELGANMGKAMVGAAKEVGVAANEFSQTPLGKVVVFITAYKIIGQDLLGLIFGTFVLLFGYSCAIWIWATRRWSDVTYEYEPILWGLMKKARVVKCETDRDTTCWKTIWAVVLLVLSSIVGLNLIFK